MANIHEMLWLVEIKIAYDVFISRHFETTLCSRKALRNKKNSGKIFFYKNRFLTGILNSITVTLYTCVRVNKAKQH